MAPSRKRMGKKLGKRTSKRIGKRFSKRFSRKMKGGEVKEYRFFDTLMDYRKSCGTKGKYFGLKTCNDIDNLNKDINKMLNAYYKKISIEQLIDINTYKYKNNDGTYTTDAPDFVKTAKELIQQKMAEDTEAKRQINVCANSFQKVNIDGTDLNTNIEYCRVIGKNGRLFLGKYQSKTGDMVKFENNEYNNSVLDSVVYNKDENEVTDPDEYDKMPQENMNDPNPNGGCKRRKQSKKRK